MRSNVDFGWYDGYLAVVKDDEADPDKLKVRVHFTDFEESEDEFWGLEILRSESEIRKRVRLLSHQLQDKECFKVAQGLTVCANYKSPDGSECKYYDGVVTKVCRSFPLAWDLFFCSLLPSSLLYFLEKQNSSVGHSCESYTGANKVDFLVYTT